MGLEFFSLHRTVLESVKEPLDLRQSNVRLSIGLLIFIVYLLIGAGVYSAIEAPVEESDAKKLRAYIQKFRSEFISDECMSDSDFEQLLSRVITASQRGISALNNVTYSPSWGFAQSFFFAGTLVSTVGYGSSSPVTQSGKAFTIAYCIVGIPLFLVLIGTFVECIKLPSVWLMGKLNSRLGHLYKPSQIQLIHLSTIVTVIVFFLFIIPAAIFEGIEKKWTYLDAFYYCFISLTTIGLGDYTPGDQPQQEFRALYKVFTTVYLMVGLLCMMLLLATVYDIPQLSLSKHFFVTDDGADPERTRLTDKTTKGPKYMQQVDEVMGDWQDDVSRSGSVTSQINVTNEDGYHY